MDWQVEGKAVTVLLLFVTAVTALNVPMLPHLLDRHAHHIMALRDAAAESSSVSDVANQLEVAMHGQCSPQEFNNFSSKYGMAVDNECEVPGATCSPRCLNPLVKTMIECKSAVGIDMVAAECGSNENGNVCLTVVMSSVRDIQTGIVACQQSVSTSECSSACRKALLAIQKDFGCCFGNYYNSSSMFATLFGDTAAPVVKSLSSYQLWDSCGVDTVGTCLYTLPDINATMDHNLTSVNDLGDKVQVTMSSVAETVPAEMLGKCSPERFDDIANTYGDFNGSECDDPEKMCEPVCLEPLIKTMEECESESVLVKMGCGRNEKGQFCTSALFSSMMDIVSLKLCHDDIGTHTCSSGCKQAMMQAKDELGCCFNNLFNSSFTNLLPLDHHTTTALANLTSYSFWKSCGVDTPGFCPHEGLTLPTQESGDSESRSRRPSFYFGPLIALLVVVVCAVAVVVFLHRRKWSTSKRLVLPKVLRVGKRGYAYRKLTHTEEAELQCESMQTEL